MYNPILINSLVWQYSSARATITISHGREFSTRGLLRVREQHYPCPMLSLAPAIPKGQLRSVPAWLLKQVQVDLVKQGRSGPERECLPQPNPAPSLIHPILAPFGPPHFFQPPTRLPTTPALTYLHWGKSIFEWTQLLAAAINHCALA